MTYEHGSTPRVAPEAAGTAVHERLVGVRQEQGEGLGCVGPSACGTADTGAGGAGADQGGSDGLSEYSRRAIYADAERASKLGQTILDACPYNAWEPEGKLWRQVFRKSEAARVRALG